MVARNAHKALDSCQIKGHPPEKYEVWKEAQLNFDACDVPVESPDKTAER